MNGKYTFISALCILNYSVIKCSDIFHYFRKTVYLLYTFFRYHEIKAMKVRNINTNTDKTKPTEKCKRYNMRRKTSPSKQV